MCRRPRSRRNLSRANAWAPPGSDRIALKARASSKRQALSVVAEIAARTLDVPAAEITSKLIARERLGSTGVRSDRFEGARLVEASGPVRRRRDRRPHP